MTDFDRPMKAPDTSSRSRNVYVVRHRRSSGTSQLKSRPFLTKRGARGYVKFLLRYGPLAHVEVSHGRVDGWEWIDPDD